MQVTAAHAQQLDVLRPTLFRIARLQLRNDAWAEDVVSETLLVALENKTAFEGRSQLKTWLVGILKHKIIDCLRARQREAPMRVTEDDDFDIETLIFKADGHFREATTEWSNPEDQLSRTQFFEILELCMQGLPPTQARIFMMREWLELSTSEICNDLAISPTNAGVLLHRARLRLRECLEIRWFGTGTP